MTHAEYVAGLRAVADFIEAHPELGTPVEQQLNIFPRVLEEEVKEHAAKAIHAVGKVTKSDYDSDIILQGIISGFALRFWYPRSAVCERIELERKIVPAEPEKTVVIPARPEIEQVVYGWKCAPILEVVSA
jgi:hypothetical protein